MLDLADLEELLSGRLPAKHPAGEEYASFDQFCDRVERLLEAGSLDDELLSLAFDRWSEDRTAEEFVAELKGGA